MMDLKLEVKLLYWLEQINLEGKISFSILNIFVNATAINVISFNSYSSYGHVKIILKIYFYKIRYITCLLILFGGTENYIIYNAQKNKFVVPYLKQLVINCNFLYKILLAIKQ